MEDEKNAHEAHVQAHAADEDPRDTALNSAAQAAQDGVAPDDTTADVAAGAAAAEHTTSTSIPTSPTDSSTAAVGDSKGSGTGVLAEERGGVPDGAATAAPAGFVAPSSYLRPAAGTRGKADGVRSGSGSGPGSPMGGSRPTTAGVGGMKVMHPLDKEQIEGLVSACLAEMLRLWCVSGILSKSLTAMCVTARNQSLPQGPNDVRRAAAQLQAYCAGYGFAGEEELEHPHTMR